MSNTSLNSPPPDSVVLIEQGQVVSVEDAFAYVQVRPQTGCSGCSASSSCGISALAGYFKTGKRGLIKVENRLKAQVGDQVELSLDQSHLIKQAFMAYGVPLLGLFVFAILFKQLALSVFILSSGGQELATIIGGGVGLLSGWYFIHKRYQPVLPKMTQVLKVV